MLQAEVIKAAGDLLTIDEFAKIVSEIRAHSVTSRTIERWLQERRIDSVKIGGAVRIPRMEVVRMLSTGYRTRSMM